MVKHIYLHVIVFGMSLYAFAMERQRIDVRTFYQASPDPIRMSREDSPLSMLQMSKKVCCCPCNTVRACCSTDEGKFLGLGLCVGAVGLIYAAIVGGAFEEQPRRGFSHASIRHRED